MTKRKKDYDSMLAKAAIERPSHYQHSTEAHWFVSNAAHWACNSVLSAALKDLAAETRRSFPKSTLPVAIHRVPGPSTATYQIRNFAPDVPGTLFCGYDNLEREAQ